MPIEEAIVPSMVQVASEADREKVRDSVWEHVYPADLQVPRDAARRVPRGDPRGPRVSGPRPTATPCTAPRSAAGRRSTSIRRRSTTSASPSSTASRRSAARSPAAAGFGDDTAAYRAALDADAANTPNTKAELVARANEDIERAMAAAPRYFGVLPKAGCDVRAGRGVQGEGRPVRLLLPAVPGRVAPRHLLRQRLRPPEPQVHEARLDDLPRGRARPPLPDRARDGEPAPEPVPSARLARGRAAPTSRAGACTANGSPTRWASIATRASGSGCSTPRPGGRRGSSSTPGSTPCAGRASDRSTSCSGPACPRRTPSSRPTATSAGRARR